MQPQIEVFCDLISRYPTWESFKEYITSPEGGQFRCVGEGRNCILRYVKGVSELKVPHGKWMRSVVWDTVAHLPVCVAPPKAETGDAVTTGEDLLVQPFLDGMMINVFRTLENPSQLQFTTRSQLGASGKFYSEKTFVQMVHEALHAMGKTQEDLLNLLASPTEVVPNHFASFVLQHPDHRVVSRCSSPRLWVVHVGAVHDSGLVSLNEDPDHWPSQWRIHRLLGFPATATGTEAGTDFFSDLCKNQGWFFQGITLKDGKGNRWRLRNPNYLYLRTLRGSESSCVDRFVRLRSESKVTEYLKHYSEDRQVFWDSEQALRKATRDVFDQYCLVHKSREKKLEDVPWAIRPCVFKLHAHYLANLRPKNEKVYMNHAVELVNNLALYEQKRLLEPVA